MKRFLVVHNPNSGIAELSNVGVFEAEDAAGARLRARESWNTTARLAAFDLDVCPDGWSYYI